MFPGIFPRRIFAAATLVFAAATADAGLFDLGFFDAPGAVHLDDGGTSFARQITFTMNRRFNAIAFDLIPTNFNYLICDSEELEGCVTETFDNVMLQGFRNGILVGLSIFDMSLNSGHLSFGSLLRNLDSLVIGFAPLPFDGTLPDGRFAVCIESPCSHFNIDNITLAAVPLPAPGLLLVAVLTIGGLGALSRRRKIFVRVA